MPTLASIEWASPAAIGTRATTVPTLVPMDTGIKQAVKDQIIAETQINESVRRILVMKHTAIEKE